MAVFGVPIAHQDDPARAVKLLERARAQFANLEAPWERARTEVELGRALLIASRPDELAAVAQAALSTFRALKAPTEIEAAEQLV